MEGNYNGDYWADRAFPESYRRAFVAAAQQIAAHFQTKGWTETLFRGLPQQQEQLQVARLVARRRRRGCWTSRQISRTSGPSVTSPGPSTKESTRPARTAAAVRRLPQAGLPRRHFAGRNGGVIRLDGLLDDNVVSSAMRTYPRLVFDRKRTWGEIVARIWLDQPGRRLKPSAGRVVPGCLVAGGRRRHPLANGGKRRIVESGRRAVAVLSAPTLGGLSGPDPIPSIRLKAYRRGQQDVEYLTLWSQLHNEPRWAVGQQVRATLKLAGTRQGTGFTGGEDAGRIDYGRLRPRDVWALRVAPWRSPVTGPSGT